LQACADRVREHRIVFDQEDVHTRIHWHFVPNRSMRRKALNNF
jgi:hypothetical protein